MNIIKIALISDNEYFPFALTTITSIINNINSEYVIYCITCDINDLEINDAKQKFKNYNVKFIEGNLNLVKNIRPKRHVSLAAYLKLILPEILPEEDRIIFLDSDLLVRKDISLLWNNFDENYSILAVWNPGYTYDNLVMGLSPEEKTFNCGVMLMNLKKMRYNNGPQKLLDFVERKNHLTILNDQAAFNAVYAKDWKQLPLTWNVQYKFFLQKYDSFNLTKEEQQEIINDPYILHFTSESKPWMFRNSHPYKKEFLRTYREVNNHIKYKDVNLKSLARKFKECYKLIEVKVND